MRILIIDDDADIRLFVTAILEGAGHQVLSAEDPMKAISLLSVAGVDALILDLMMPRFTGFELLEIMHRDIRSRLLPVLLLSAFSKSEIRARGMRLGAADFLAKPFTPEDLIESVERLVSHREISSAGVAGDGESGLIRVFEDLQRKRASGVLCLSSPSRRGWLELREGKLIGAQIGLLEGTEAILSMLTLRDNRYSFEPGSEAEIQAAHSSEIFDLPQLATRVARLEDELGRYRDDLPAENAGLFAARALSTGVYPAGDLPFPETYERIDTLPGITLEELLAQEFVSSIRLRLSVALLARAAVIEAVDEVAGAEGDSSPD